MTVIEGIDALAAWLEGEVCSGIKLKVPSNARQTDGYEYKLAHPKVHKMYAPPAKLAHQGARQLCPGILLCLADGRDAPRKSGRDLKFRLLLSVWNPGRHAEDSGEPGAGERFQATADGWEDAWNLMDLLLAKLYNAEQIGGVLRVKAEDGFDYGPYKEDGAIIDFYPFYFATLEFSCAMSLAPPSKYCIENYL